MSPVTLRYWDLLDGDEDFTASHTETQIIKWYHDNPSLAPPFAPGWIEIRRWPLRIEAEYDEQFYDTFGEQGSVVYTITRDGATASIELLYDGGTVIQQTVTPGPVVTACPGET